MTLPLKPNPAIPPTITTAIDPLYCDKQQFAKMWDVSLRTVDYWIAKNLVPYIKIGGVIRFDVQQCREVVKKRYTHEQGELWANGDVTLEPPVKRGRGRPRKNQST